MSIKRFNIFLIILAVIFLSYGWVWFESYHMFKQYYKQAMQNYDNGEYIIALKGDQVLSEDQTRYIFEGGFQQAMDIWSSPYALPKPKLYWDTQEKIRTIIDEKIDIEMGKEAFKKYFQLDNKYLGDILLRMGDLYIQQGNTNKAEETYTIVKDAFARDVELLTKAEERLSALNTSTK